MCTSRCLGLYMDVHLTDPVKSVKTYIIQWPLDPNIDVHPTVASVLCNSFRLCDHVHFTAAMIL
jgi:hypothetical protein